MKTTFAISVSLLVAAIWVPPASACSCSKLPLAQYFDNATVVFQGYPTVIRLDQEPAGTTGILANKVISRTVIEFHTEKWFKGEPVATAIVLTGMGGGDCGSDFHVGQHWIVFAMAGKDGLGTSICHGNLYVDHATAEIEQLNRLVLERSQPK